MTPRAVAGVEADLSERDRLVLTSVSDHRFMTTQQIERLHFTDHATPLAAARSCRRVLARLHTHRILHRLERRVGGVHAGSAGYVWSIGLVGDHLLRQSAGDGIRRRIKEPSTTFLDHTLAIADAHLALVEAARTESFDLVAVEHEPACWRTFTAGSGGNETLRPDLYVETGNRDYEDCWFLEIDRGTESLPTLIRKCGQYEAYRRSGREQARLGTFPLVVWVLPNEARIDKLQDAITRTRQLDPQLFRLTTPEQLAERLAKGPD